MNRVVLSGVNVVVLSGAKHSCYQAHATHLTACIKIKKRALNLTNFKTLSNVNNFINLNHIFFCRTIFVFHKNVFVRAAP